MKSDTFFILIDVQDRPQNSLTTMKNHGAAIVTLYLQAKSRT